MELLHRTGQYTFAGRGLTVEYTPILERPDTLARWEVVTTRDELSVGVFFVQHRRIVYDPMTDTPARQDAEHEAAIAESIWAA